MAAAAVAATTNEHLNLVPNIYINPINDAIIANLATNATKLVTNVSNIGVPGLVIVGNLALDQHSTAIKVCATDSIGNIFNTYKRDWEEPVIHAAWCLPKTLAVHAANRIYNEILPCNRLRGKLYKPDLKDILTIVCPIILQAYTDATTYEIEDQNLLDELTFALTPDIYGVADESIMADSDDSDWVED